MTADHNSLLAELRRGVELYQAGRLDGAATVFESVLRSDPTNPDALNLLGVLAGVAGRHDDAIALYDRALAVNPRFAEAHFNRANALRAKGKVAAAIGGYQEALTLNPRYAEAWLNLGVSHADDGQRGKAIEVFRAMAEAFPQEARAHFNLGQCLAREGQPAEAVAALTRAQQIAPENREIAAELALALSAVGDTHRAHGRWFEAMSAYEASLQGQQLSPVTVHKMSSIMGAREWPALAAVVAEAAVDLQPDNQQLVYNLALFELKRGRLAVGWEKYESRFKAMNVAEPSSPPRWRGEDLSGRCLLVWPEQGIGEQVLFSSVLPDVIARAAKVYVVVEPRLHPILARALPTATILAGSSGASHTVPEDADWHSPLGSLAALLRRDFGSFPKHTGYLRTDPDRTSELRTKYQGLAGSRRIVGISWRSANAAVGPEKSAVLGELAEILRQPDVMFVNLQYGDCAADLAEIEKTLGVSIHQDPAINPISDLNAYFAQVAAMDLVISTSNTCIHVAGALNVPAWLLLPKGAGSLWYWFTGRADSPWYPSLRLFRQPDILSDEPWARAVAAKAAVALKAWLATKI